VLVVGFDGATLFVVTTVFHQVSRIVLVVVPLFVLVGLIAAAGGISRDTYHALSLWLNRVPGGLGIATVAGCTAFGTICGSALVTAAVFAKSSVPDMRRIGYDKRLSYGLVSAAGTIGMLIPPSVVIVVYAILTEESPGRLLIGGLTPGILLFILFSIGVWVIGRIKPALVGGAVIEVEKVSWRQRIVSLRLLWPMAAVAVTIVGGVFAGWFSPTEAAAVAVTLLFLIVVISQRSIKPLVPAFADSAAISAMIFFIFIGATVFSRFLTITGLADIVLEWVIGLELSHLGMVIAMAAIYIVMGCFLDAISMIALSVPIIYPTIRVMGIDPIWYGISVILAIHVASITPPVGLNVYAVKGVAEADVSLEDIFIGVVPWFFLMLVALAIVIAFPVLSTTLPALIMD
ncbi:TRAP transporter large permease, partial [Dehalococcoidia bacterium]|nr:TRAP transporter large permease [Dehalococcoidia bacterium]